MKNNFYWFTEGQTHVGMLRGPKRVGPSMYRNGLPFIQIQILHLSIHHNWKESNKYLYQISNGKS